eukprot:288031-Prorocentrum_minimum.AAC.2
MGSSSIIKVATDHSARRSMACVHLSLNPSSALRTGSSMSSQASSQRHASLTPHATLPAVATCPMGSIIRPIKCRNRKYILTTDQSDAGSAQVYSQRHTMTARGGATHVSTDPSGAHLRHK